jgi:hypothetical protein
MGMENIYSNCDITEGQIISEEKSFVLNSSQK